MPSVCSPLLSVPQFAVYNLLDASPAAANSQPFDSASVLATGLSDLKLTEILATEKEDKEMTQGYEYQFYHISMNTVIKTVIY